MADTYTIKSGKAYIAKDPDATLDYPFDWSAWLADIEDEYASHEIVVDEGLTLVSSSYADGVITPFVSGGTLSQKHAVTCRITTVGGRIDDRTIYLDIKDR